MKIDRRKLIHDNVRLGLGTAFSMGSIVLRNFLDRSSDAADDVIHIAVDASSHLGPVS
ncbi:MAG: hypothetical protein HKN87_01120 [Saprospiraceae bacterium]|nr:hypothetical protein [Saprospiraceae bacterium]